MTSPSGMSVAIRDKNMRERGVGWGWGGGDHYMSVRTQKLSAACFDSRALPSAGC